MTNHYLIHNDFLDQNKTRELLFKFALSAAESNHHVHYITANPIEEIPGLFKYNTDTFKKIHFIYSTDMNTILKNLLIIKYYLPKIVIVELDSILKLPINEKYIDNYAFFISTLHAAVQNFSKVQSGGQDNQTYNSVICYRRLSDTLDEINDLYFNDTTKFETSILLGRSTNNFIRTMFSI